MAKTTIQPDSLFQIFIRDFAAAFGIQNPAELETQKREIVPESVQMDTVVSFPDDFDFTSLQNCIFPFWGKENVIEYKGANDRLSPLHIYQYSWTELGILTTHLLSKKREDRKERQPLSQKKAKAQWLRLQAQGAQHSCCNTIITTHDPARLRESAKFVAVDTYEHLQGALYRRVIGEDEFIGSVATYLVVLNDLPLHPKNAPLLLLSTDNKLIEFCEWLLETHEGIKVQEKQLYLLYLMSYNLVQDKGVLNKMLINRSGKPDNTFTIIEILAEQSDNKAEFLQKIAKTVLKDESPTETIQIMLQVDSPNEAAQKILQVNSPLEMAQRALQANSAMEVAQRVLQADSPMEVAQTALQADTPVEAAYQFIQSEEEVERLLELIRQRNAEKQPETLDDTVQDEDTSQ